MAFRRTTSERACPSCGRAGDGDPAGADEGSSSREICRCGEDEGDRLEGARRLGGVAAPKTYLDEALLARQANEQEAAAKPTGARLRAAVAYTPGRGLSADARQARAAEEEARERLRARLAALHRDEDSDEGGDEPVGESDRAQHAEHASERPAPSGDSEEAPIALFGEGSHSRAGELSASDAMEEGGATVSMPPRSTLSGRIKAIIILIVVLLLLSWATLI